MYISHEIWLYSYLRIIEIIHVIKYFVYYCDMINNKNCFEDRDYKCEIILLNNRR